MIVANHDGAWLRLSGGDSRSVLAQGAAEQHDDNGLLRRGAPGGAGPLWPAADLQYGPGRAVHRYTDTEFSSTLKEHGIAINMDG
jgi:hypothetical protein